LIGSALVSSRRFEEAIPKLLASIQNDEDAAVAPYRWLVACYAHMGRLEEARATLARLRAISSVMIPEASNLRNAEHRELFLSGLRLAISESAASRHWQPILSRRSDSQTGKMPSLD